MTSTDQPFPNLDSYRIPDLPSSFYYIPSFVSSTESQSLLTKLPPNRWVQLTHRRLQAHPSPLTSNSSLLGAPLPPYLTNPILPRLEHLGIFKETPHGQPNHCLVNEYRPGEGIMPHEDGPAYAPVVATVSLGGAVVLEGYSRVEGDAVAKQQLKSQTGILTPTVTTAVPSETTVAAEALNSPAELALNGVQANGISEKDDLPTPSDTRPPTSSPEPATDALGRPIALFRILLEPNSLFVTTSSAYTTLLHGISPISVDRGLGPATVANWEQLGDPDAYQDGKNERVTRVSLTYRDVLKVSDAGRRILGGRR